MSGAGGGGETGLALAALLSLVLALGAGGGAVVRAVVLSRVGRTDHALARSAGSAWVNVPASALAAALVVTQQRLVLLPGEAGLAPVLLTVAALGVCGGLSTWSTLALELSRAVLAGDRGLLLLRAGGVLAGLLGGVFGAGCAVLVLSLL